MKKLVFIGSVALSLLAPLPVLAANIMVSPPPQGFKTLGNFVTNAITVTLGIALLIVLVMLIIGAYEWITSGGDKENVAKARNRIINALIGIAVLAVALALANLAAQFTGFNIFNIAIPSPDTAPPPSGQV